MTETSDIDQLDNILKAVPGTKKSEKPATPPAKKQEAEQTDDLPKPKQRNVEQAETKKSESPQEEGNKSGSPMLKTPLTEGQTQILQNPRVWTMTPQGLAELVWPNAQEGKYPGFGAASALLAQNFQMNWNGKTDEETAALKAVVKKNIFGKMFNNDDLKIMPFKEAIDEVIKRKGEFQKTGTQKPAPQKRKAGSFKPKAEEINSIFDIGSGTSQSAGSLIEAVLGPLDDRVWTLIIKFVDLFAGKAPAPSKAFAILTKPPKDQPQGTVGAFRRRLAVKPTPEQIIETCVNPKYFPVSQLVTRVTNPLQAYQVFLNWMEKLAGGDGAGLQWSWLDLLRYIKDHKFELATKIATESIVNFSQNKVFSQGSYGPIVWLVKTDLMLQNMEFFNEQLKDQFKEENTGRIACPRDLQIQSPMIAIPLCGSECYAYMTQAQLEKRARIGLPWARFDQKPLKMGRQPTAAEVRKLINKSASAYQAFLSRQISGTRRYKQKTGRRSEQATKSSGFDLGNDYTD